MLWTCPGCNNIVSDSRVCDVCGMQCAADAESAAAVADMPGGRDLATEANVMAVGLWMRVQAIILGAVIGLWCLTLSFAVGTVGWHGLPVAALIVAVALATLAGCVASWLIGRYLGELSSGGRLAAAVLTAVGLVLEAARLAFNAPTIAGYLAFSLYGALVLAFLPIVVGLAWQIALVVLLFSDKAKRVTSEPYRRLVRATPDEKANVYGSPYFRIPLFVLLGAFVLAVAAGMYSSATEKRPLDRASYYSE